MLANGLLPVYVPSNGVDANKFYLFTGCQTPKSILKKELLDAPDAEKVTVLYSELVVMAH